MPGLEHSKCNATRSYCSIFVAVSVEEAIAALSTFSLEDDQPEVQGLTLWVSSERGATISPIDSNDDCIGCNKWLEWKLYQLQVKCAFFHGKLEEDVYVARPLGCEVVGKENRVYTA
ncbi:hypothetical protein L1887_22637 [Cichorium endivia]|nr:hypothetical protein L1887_22637 [Cichorium endivia]